jgi:hypothetical protein
MQQAKLNRGRVEEHDTGVWQIEEPEKVILKLFCEHEPVLRDEKAVKSGQQPGQH